MTLLKVSNVSCGYDGPPVVEDISFTVKKGQKLCILGPNGCGKTTLLRGLVGILPIKGSVTVDGEDVAFLNARQKGLKIALMSQLTETYFPYTVYETVMLGRYVHQKRSMFSEASNLDRRMVEESLNLVGMLDLADRPITELSGGQLQRVFLARCFAQDPKVILLDEPTNHLDLRYQVELIETLKEWAKKGERCVVGVLHDINLALSFADTVLLMENGRIKAFEAVENLDLALINEIYRMDVGEYMKESMKRWEENR